MNNVIVFPGSMGVVQHSIDLFGIDRVDPGSWMTPVVIVNLTDEEAAFAKEYFEELDFSVNIRQSVINKYRF